MVVAKQNVMLCSRKSAVKPILRHGEKTLGAIPTYYESTTSLIDLESPDITYANAGAVNMLLLISPLTMDISI